MLRPIRISLFLVGLVGFISDKATADIYALRMGDGTAFTNTGADASAVFVDRFTDAGSLISTFNLPTTASGANRPLTLPAASTSVGHMSLSTDGQYLLLGGADADVGTATVRQTTIGRVAGRIKLSDGSIDTTTSLTDAYPGSAGNNNDVRSVVSTDGIDLWTSGTSFPTTPGGVPNYNAGIHYATLGSTTSLRLSNTPTNTRVANIYNGQLYTSSASGSFIGISAVGTGLPKPTGGNPAGEDLSTTTIFVNTSLSGSGTVSPYDFWFKDDNTVYVADDRGARSGATLLGGGIQKWSRADGSSPWGLEYILALPGDSDGMRGLDGAIVNGNAVLYGTTATTGSASLNANSIVTITDTGAASTYTVLAPSGTNKIYRGIVHINAPAGVQGDYNGNGVVDGADYVVWRNGGSPDSSLAGYNLWRSKFGNTSGSGSGLSGSAVPEPATAMLLLLGLAAFVGRRRAS